MGQTNGHSGDRIFPRKEKRKPKKKRNCGGKNVKGFFLVDALTLPTCTRKLVEAWML